MGILFTILMGILFTITMGILFTIVLGIQFTISNYSSYYEFVVDNKSPLVFSFQNSSEYDFSTEL
jgi:hypothetical protein